MMNTRFFGRKYLGSLALVLLTCTANAQDHPMWTNVPRQIPKTLSQSKGTGSNIKRGIPASLMATAKTGISAMSLTVPDSVDAEVAALAAALGSGGATSGEDPTAGAVRIFNWVHNNIGYDCYYGLRKGSALTLLEGSGNDIDQCALLVDLLRAAGYTSTRLLQFSNSVDYASIESWMGLADEPWPGKTFQAVYGYSSTDVFGVALTDKVAKQILWGYYFLSNRGCGVAANGGYPHVDPSGFPNARLVFDRLIVELTINGGTYYLDPSYKTYSKTAGINLLSATGYSRTAILTQAGGTADANSVLGLNQTAVGTYLNGCTATLSNYLNSNMAGATIDNLVSGRSVVKTNITNLNDAITQSTYIDSETFSFFNSIADSAFSSLKTTVRFQYLAASGIDYTINTADLKGRKITLTFTGNTAELRLDDGSPVATGTVTGTP